MAIDNKGTLNLSTAEAKILTAVQTEIDTKQASLSKGVNTTGTNGEIGVTGMTTNDGVIVTPLATAVPFYVTMGTASFLVKAVSDNSAVTGLKVAWCKV